MVSRMQMAALKHHTSADNFSLQNLDLPPHVLAGISKWDVMANNPDYFYEHITMSDVQSGNFNAWRKPKATQMQPGLKLYLPDPNHKSNRSGGHVQDGGEWIVLPMEAAQAYERDAEQKKAAQNKGAVPESTLDAQAISADVTRYAGLTRSFGNGLAIVRDLGINGKFYTKIINGVEFVIFKGYAGNRSKFNATKYKLSNPTVASLRLDVGGAMRSVNQGFGVSVVIYSLGLSWQWAMREITDDPMLWHEFTANLTTGISRSYLGSLVGSLAHTMAARYLKSGAVATMMTVSTGYAVPALVGIGVGFAATFYLGELDKWLGTTDWVQAKLKDSGLGDSVSAWMDKTIPTIQRAFDDYNRIDNTHIYLLSQGGY